MNGLKFYNMKIGVDLRPLLHGDLSGVPTYTKCLVKEMIRHKEHEFVLFLSGWDEKYKKILDQFQGENVRKVFWRIPNRVFNVFPRLDFDVDVFLFPDMRPAILPKKVKKVVICHDLSFIKFPGFFSFKSRLWYFFNNPRKYFRGADRVISVSKFTQKELANILGVRSEVVYEGAYVPKCKDFACVKRKYGLPDKYILSLSALEPRKNLKKVIEAYLMADLDCEFVLAGSFDEKIFAKYSLPKNTKIRFVGPVAHEDKEALYKLSSGLVYVSLYEGFGLPVLEAMSCGVNVLTSKGSSMEEIGDDAILYADPLSVDDIVSGMRKLVAGEPDKGKLAARAKEFSWEKAAGEVVKQSSICLSRRYSQI